MLILDGTDNANRIATVAEDERILETEIEDRVDTSNQGTSESGVFESSARIYFNTLGQTTTINNKPGSYALSALKKMAGTQGFMDLEDGIKGCQFETYEECVTKGDLKAVQDQCGCVPWAFSSLFTEKVGIYK